MSTPSATAALHRLIAQAVALHEAAAARLGLNATDLRCLGLIGAEAGMTPSRLAELTGLTTGAITGVLDRLERAGYVRRVPDAADRRRLTVEVNPERVGELAAHYAPLVERAAALGADLGVAERARLASFLESMAGAFGEEAERLRVVTRGGLLDNVYVAPLAGAMRGRLAFHSGAPRLSFGAAALGQQVRMVAETASTRLTLRAAAPTADELVRATFDGPPPDVRAADGSVSMRYRRRLIDVRSRHATLALHPSVPWGIEIDGGVTDLDADLHGLELVAFEVRGGANHLRLVLPEPRGSVRVTLDGGSSDLRVVRPPGSGIELRLRGGVSDLRFDGQRLASVGGDLRLASETYAGAADRYELEVSGGVSRLRIGTR